ncbi:hypothetical protein GYH30_009451 [Glycine max]|uniref:Uncharacterized protein n=1 Tax=Glycine max TaxID=3847 RepID=A0A0R0KCW2_SOYBN|nr:hypothetical protein GYH30_009451 [Glycine max]
MVSLVLPSVFPSFSLCYWPISFFLLHIQISASLILSRLFLCRVTSLLPQLINFFVPAIIKMVVVLCFFCFLTIASFSTTWIMVLDL